MLASSIAAADESVGAQFVEGFYAVEDHAWRWTAPRFAVELGVPAAARASGARIRLSFALNDQAIAAKPVLSVTATVGDFTSPAQTFSKGGNHEFVAEVPAVHLTSDKVRVQYTLNRGFAPGGGDTRELGLIAQSITLEPK